MSVLSSHPCSTPPSHTPLIHYFWSHPTERGEEMQIRPSATPNKYNFHSLTNTMSALRTNTKVEYKYRGRPGMINKTANIHFHTKYTPRHHHDNHHIVPHWFWFWYLWPCPPPPQSTPLLWKIELWVSILSHYYRCQGREVKAVNCEQWGPRSPRSGGSCTEGSHGTHGWTHMCGVDTDLRVYKHVSNSWDSQRRRDKQNILESVSGYWPAVAIQRWCSSISCAAIITRIDLTSLLQDSLPRDDNSTWHLPATWTNDQWQKLDDMDIFCQKYPSPRVYISQDQMWNVYILSKKNSLSFNPSGICWKKFDDDIQVEAEAMAITGKNSRNGHH